MAIQKHGTEDIRRIEVISQENSLSFAVGNRRSLCLESDLVSPFSTARRLPSAVRATLVIAAALPRVSFVGSMNHGSNLCSGDLFKLRALKQEIEHNFDMQLWIAAILKYLSSDDPSHV